MKKTIFLLLALFISTSVSAVSRFSTAGFYELPNTGREVYSMNLAWRFFKGDLKDNPYSRNYDDSEWDVVSIPHGIEYLPTEASGCINYQGPVWYRKHFTIPSDLTGKKLFLHFEGIMGKSDIYVNGKLLKKHYGGYLPVIIDISNAVILNGDNTIAVRADNSDDPTYPVGKPQNMLDFTYFGGIYRDCWLVTHNNVFITNANYEDETAGGGVFVSYDNVSEKEAEINMKAHIRNESPDTKNLYVIFNIKDKEGNAVRRIRKKLRLNKKSSGYVHAKTRIGNPNLWSPESPYLYNLDITIEDGKGNTLDGYRQRIGIRSIEFKNEDGLWINGKQYEGKIMGTNRHQDYAVLGNAVPNSMQWRDAKKLRDAGLTVIRTHYVIDPAFMDACDELGLFALVEVPGWQFWNNAPVFSERLYSDIRNMVRIHRNHASLFFWEPILNETRYPESFARKALEICKEEYPYPYSTAACDHGATGDKYYPLLLRPIESKLDKNKTYFIREWGDNVDDWNAQNSDSRVARGWGEVPMLIQAEHYGAPQYLDDYPILCYETICQKPRQIVGGCFWHSFDHQRGYHADPFYGGIMDAFRQPKYSYYMFMSQRPTEKTNIIAETGPMVYIANELTPFSPADITVYSNCDEVRLTVFESGKTYTYRKDKKHNGMPSPIIKFKNAYHFMEWKDMARNKKQDKAYLMAEGLIDGKTVAVHKRYPAGQAYRIRLRLDDENMALKADGSDVISIVAEIVDKRGTVKRLNNSIIRFNVEGEGKLIGNNITGVNPQHTVWGSAVALVQSTNKTGKIKVTASIEPQGQNRPLDGVLEFESIQNDMKEIFSEKEYANITLNKPSVSEKHIKSDLERENEKLRKELNQIKVKEVENQQTEFGKGIND